MVTRDGEGKPFLFSYLSELEEVETMSKKKKKKRKVKRPPTPPKVIRKKNTQFQFAGSGHSYMRRGSVGFEELGKRTFLEL